jgi:hypothetical protein
VALIARVFPALALLAPRPSSLVPAAGLAVAGIAVYLVIGSVAWRSVGGHAVRMLLARG